MRLNSDLVVPQGWGVVPLKRLTRFGYGEAISADDRDPAGTVKVYGSNGPFDRHSASNTFGPCIIVGRKGSYGKCQYSDDPVFAVDTTFVIDKRHTNANMRYLYHLLGILGLDELSDDTAVPGLSREKAYQSLTPLPPLETQRRIAAFLDEKTAQIDGLIAKKQALLERLAEKRQAIITGAVTKGLNPNAPMKDSGIDWLGQIPAHWEVKRLSFVTQVIDCKHRTPGYIDDGIPLVSTTEISPYHIDYQTKRQVSEEELAVMSEGGRQPRIDDIIYSRNASVGSAALVRDGRTICLGQDLCLIRPTAITPGLLEHFLNSTACLEQLGSYLVGATFKRVNVDVIKKYILPLPPCDEQAAIVNFVSAQIAKAKHVERMVSNSVASLAEYRAAMITAAVTGQIEGLQ